MKGLSKVLLQKGRPVMYASKTLTPAETGYSNIEGKHLSVVFVLKRLHHYVFGSKTKVQTDHKPLILTWKKSIVTASPQPQCLLLRLTKHDVELTYLKVKDNAIADAQSQCSPLEPKPEDKDNFGVIPVHDIILEILL